MGEKDDGGSVRERLARLEATANATHESVRDLVDAIRVEKEARDKLCEKHFAMTGSLKSDRDKVVGAAKLAMAPAFVGILLWFKKHIGGH